jgi:hypothetical protein
MGLIADDFCQDVRDMGRPTDDLIDWRQRYDGVLMVAYLDGKAVAGVSGPWPVNQYALTWWDRPMPARQLELFDSLAAAQERVEEWAWRMRTIGVIDRPPANDPILPEATVSIVPAANEPVRSEPKVSMAPSMPASRAPSTWLDRLRDKIAGASSTRPAREKVEALRYPPLRDEDLRDIHFAAFE